MSELDEFFQHTVAVETWLGTNGYGADVYADPVTLSPATGSGCFAERVIRRVLDKTGEQVVSATTVYARIAAESLFLPGSRVTIRGSVSQVISVGGNELDALELPSHIAVALT